MSSKAVGTYFINYHLEMCFCWKERETRSSEFPVLVQNIFVRFCTSKNSAQLPDDLLELKVATTAVNSISDRSNRTAGFIIALFSRIRSPWARHDGRCEENAVRKQRSKEMMILRIERQSQEWNQAEEKLKSLVKPSKMCECLWVGECLSDSTYTSNICDVRKHSYKYISNRKHYRQLAKCLQILAK